MKAPSLKPATRLRLSRTHRLLGMAATIPILGWIGSSAVLHGVALALPNGLQGVYELEPYHVEQVRLESLDLLPPSAILRNAAADGLQRVYWLRLEALAGRAVYIVKPGPFEVERVYDAQTGDRLDPLPPEMLRAIAEGELVDTRVAHADDETEFNRYYTLDRVPVVSFEMEGAQPSELVLTRASGRTQRRTDPGAAWFERAYKSVHVWQWGDSLRLFTALLYSLMGMGLLLVSLGYFLWWDRREARRRWTDSVRTSRRIHARLAPFAGLLLATQMMVGAFLWFNLGLIEPRFRGQGSFETEWTGGITVGEVPASVAEIVSNLPSQLREAAHPIQRYEWRAIGDRRFWLVFESRNAEGVLIAAESGDRLERLTPDLARIAGESVVQGETVGEPEESTEYWMDFNARIPTYRFRFADPDDSDVHISQISGEVIQRRPAIWRRFGPFLVYHTFGFTGNPVFDTLLLSALQLAVLTMVATGWMMALRMGGKSARGRELES